MDLTVYDCMSLFSVSDSETIILEADDMSEERYELSNGWKSFSTDCKRQTWKYCQVSRIDVRKGYIRFWIEV